MITLTLVLDSRTGIYRSKGLQSISFCDTGLAPFMWMRTPASVILKATNKNPKKKGWFKVTVTPRGLSWDNMWTVAIHRNGAFIPTLFDMQNFTVTSGLVRGEIGVPQDVYFKLIQ